MPSIEKGKNWCRKRIKDPKKFDKKSFRVKSNKKTKVVIGCPKGKYDSASNTCKVGTRVQSIMKKKNKDGTCPKF